MMKRNALAVLISFFAVTAAVAAPADSRTPVTVIQPDPAFVSAVQPIVGRLEKVRYFSAGPYVIGVYGENPTADTPAQRPVQLFFDKSGQFMLVGSVMEWKKNRNLSALAVAQFATQNPMGEQAKAAMDAQDELAVQYKEAVQKDIAANQARISETNAQAIAAVDAFIAKGIPTIDHGTGAMTITAFVDLNCPHCKKAANDLVAYASKEGRGKVKVRFVLTANPKDGQRSNAAAMVYGSKSPVSALLSSMNKLPAYDAALAKAGAKKLADVQGAVHALQIRSIPFFVIDKGTGVTRKQSGYNELGALLK